MTIQEAEKKIAEKHYLDIYTESESIDKKKPYTSILKFGTLEQYLRNSTSSGEVHIDIFTSNGTSYLKKESMVIDMTTSSNEQKADMAKQVTSVEQVPNELAYKWRIEDLTSKLSETKAELRELKKEHKEVMDERNKLERELNTIQDKHELDKSNSLGHVISENKDLLLGILSAKQQAGSNALAGLSEDQKYIVDVVSSLDDEGKQIMVQAIKFMQEGNTRFATAFVNLISQFVNENKPQDEHQ